MFVNRSSSPKIINPPDKARSQVVPFNRVPNEGEKGQNIRDRESKNFWVEMLRALGDWFLHGDAPRIQEKRDRDGQLYFKVYDPCSQQSYAFDTETEVRAWLEKRYSY